MSFDDLFRRDRPDKTLQPVPAWLFRSGPTRLTITLATALVAHFAISPEARGWAVDFIYFSLFI